jgi:hypothetical protein
VAGVVAPDIELAGNFLGVEDVGHLLVHLATDIVDAGGEDAGVAAVVIEVMGIVHVRHVVGRQVEVAILVVVAGEEAGWVERAAHRENGGKDLRVTEADVNRMVTPKAASEGGEAGVTVSTADEGDDLIEEVLLEPEMAGQPGAWDDGTVVPAFGVNGIDTEELQIASFELVLNSRHHATVFEVEEASTGGRKSEGGRTGVSKDE